MVTRFPGWERSRWHSVGKMCRAVGSSRSSRAWSAANLDAMWRWALGFQIHGLFYFLIFWLSWVNAKKMNHDYFWNNPPWWINPKLSRYLCWSSCQLQRKNWLNVYRRNWLPEQELVAEALKLVVEVELPTLMLIVWLKIGQIDDAIAVTLTFTAPKIRL